MRGLHLVLLAALLCSDRALSLQCYFCTGLTCNIMTCGQGPSVCYKIDLLATWQHGRKESMKQEGCANSCDQASSFAQDIIKPGIGFGPMDNAVNGTVPLVPKLEVQGVSCCDKDLCNGVSRAGRSLWALAGGLLLSLGPALLWAQL